MSLAEAKDLNMTEKSVRLRLEVQGGSAGREYRVDEGKVEVRSLQSRGEHHPVEGRWHRLTAQQLSIHVERNTVVALWLERRLGWKRLLQACVGPEIQDWVPAEDRANSTHGEQSGR
jgi:hypothetical protein